MNLSLSGVRLLCGGARGGRRSSRSSVADASRVETRGQETKTKVCLSQTRQEPFRPWKVEGEHRRRDRGAAAACCTTFSSSSAWIDNTAVFITELSEAGSATSDRKNCVCALQISKWDQLRASTALPETACLAVHKDNNKVALR